MTAPYATLREVPVDPDMLDFIGTDHGLTAADDEALRTKVECLPPRLRRIIEGVFWERTTNTALGAEMSVGRQRISQLKAEALELLKGDPCSANGRKGTDGAKRARSANHTATTTAKSPKVRSTSRTRT